MPTSPNAAARETVGPRSRPRWPWVVGGVVALAAVVVGVGVSRLQQPMGLRPSQRATISPQAAKFIDGAKVPQVPDFMVPVLAGRQAVLKGQTTFAASERPIEDGIIARYRLKLHNTTIAGVPVTIVTPPAIAPGNEKAIALDIHGGGFVSGTSRERTALLMAHDLGIRVYSIDYALAPQAQYPVALNQCLAVYRALVGRFDPRQIVGLSSSSGGSVMLAMILEARRQKLPMIAGLGLFTPAADISGDGDSGVSNDGRDVVPLNLARGTAALYYAPGHDLREPGISPIYGRYDATFPPTIMTTGTRDLLLSNSVRLYAKLQDAGVTSQLIVAEGMWHGFNWEPDLPEAVRARALVAKFLNQQLHRGS